MHPYSDLFAADRSACYVMSDRSIHDDDFDYAEVCALCVVSDLPEMALLEMSLLRHCFCRVRRHTQVPWKPMQTTARYCCLTRVRSNACLMQRLQGRVPLIARLLVRDWKRLLLPRPSEWLQDFCL